MNKIIVKYFLITFFILFHSKICSDDYIFDVTGEDVINLELETTQGVKKILRHTEGNFTDNWGDYGKSVCIGDIDTDNNKKVTLDLMCENTNQSDEKLWSILYRVNTEDDAAIGVIEYIDGTGKYKKLIGKKCNYAIKFYKKNTFFTKGICKLN